MEKNANKIEANKKIGQNLKKVRTQKGFSRKTLEKKISSKNKNAGKNKTTSKDITADMIAKYESGSRTCPSDVLTTLCAELEISVNDIQFSTDLKIDYEKSPYLSERLMLARKSKNYTTKELEKLSGIPHSTINRMENFDEMLKNISTAKFLKICECLEITDIDAFINNTKTKASLEKELREDPRYNNNLKEVHNTIFDTKPSLTKSTFTERILEAKDRLANYAEGDYHEYKTKNHNGRNRYGMTQERLIQLSRIPNTFFSSKNKLKNNNLEFKLKYLIQLSLTLKTDISVLI